MNKTPKKIKYALEEKNNPSEKLDPALGKKSVRIITK